MEITLIVILAIIFIATLSRATFGFGDALIAMPLLVLFINVKTATPLVALLAIIISTAILINSWRKIKVKALWPLILSSIAGIPLGLFYLKGTSEVIVKSVLAIILILFSLYNLTKPDLLKFKNDKLAVFFGFAGGILGGAYNTNGPPIIIYGTLRNWEPSRFRAILQGIFLPTNIFITLGHGIVGLWTSEVWNLFFWSLPVVVIAILIGNKLNRIIPAEKFSIYIYIFLLVIGFVLIYRTLIM